MKKYKISFKVEEHGSVIVEAENADEARELYIEAIDQGNADYNKVEYTEQGIEEIV